MGRRILFWAVLLYGICKGATAAPLDDFEAARKAYQHGNLNALNAHAARLQSHPLYAYAAYWQLMLTLPETTASAVDAYAARFPDTVLADRLRAAWLKRQAALKNWPAFRRAYPALEFRDDTLVCDALQARRNIGDAQALQEARALWLAPRALPPACTAVFDDLVRSGYTQEDVWQRIRLLLAADQVAAARALATRYLPATEQAPFRLLGREKYFPHHYLHPGALDLAQRANRELALYALFQEARRNLPAAFADWQLMRGRYPAAAQAYTWGVLAALAAHARDPVAVAWFQYADDRQLNDEELAWKVRAALMAGKWTMVRAAIEAMSPTGKKRPAWRYWLARAYLAQGDRATADRLLKPLAHRISFYGQLAAEELGQPLYYPASWQPPAALLAQLARSAQWQRIVLLHAVDMRAALHAEWRYAVRHADDEQRLGLAELARQQGWYDLSIYAADHTRHKHNFALRYPMPYRRLVTDYAQRHQISEAWVYGLMRQESRFAPAARSQVGARGLMQIMPATGEWIARKLGLGRLRGGFLGAPEYNIQFGTFYLSHILQASNGHTALATAAYNAGLGRIHDWRPAHPTEGAIYVEAIPYLETRRYVQKVLSNASYYALELGLPGHPLKERLGIVR